MLIFYAETDIFVHLNRIVYKSYFLQSIVFFGTLECAFF